MILAMRCILIVKLSVIEMKEKVSQLMIEVLRSLFLLTQLFHLQDRYCNAYIMMRFWFNRIMYLK